MIGHKPDSVTYAPIMMGNVAMINIQIAKILPNFLVPPSAFVEAKRTKNPIVARIVAGMKLKKKHIGFPPSLIYLISVP
jgi:hypothetical protein